MPEQRALLQHRLTPHESRAANTLQFSNLDRVLSCPALTAIMTDLHKILPGNQVPCDPGVGIESGIIIFRNQCCLAVRPEELHHHILWAQRVDHIPPIRRSRKPIEVLSPTFPIDACVRRLAFTSSSTALVRAPCLRINIRSATKALSIADRTSFALVPIPFRVQEQEETA